MKTWNAKTEEVDRKWWLVDASGLTLGRLASEIAKILRGKTKPIFTPHVDTGDFVVVVNAEKVVLTGNKWTEKKYYRHSRYFGSLKTKKAEEIREAEPSFLLEEAVKGMLPKNKMSRHMILKLKAYKGPDHPHQSQKPVAITFEKTKNIRSEKMH